VFDGQAGLHQNYFRDYDPAIGAYAESDPIGMRGGLNPYTYVDSGPVLAADPFGLWSTAAHNAIIQDIGQQWGLPPDLIAAMQQGSYAADHGKSYQDAYHSFMHAMSSSKLTKAEACKKLNKFVSDSVNKGFALANSGDLLGAYREWGFGLHAIMDSTSPVHAGFQEWHMRDFYKHGPFPTSKEDVNSLTPQLLKQTTDLMNAAMNGDTLNCSCYE
jgi:RHS repeat-associated protein